MRRTGHSRPTKHIFSCNELPKNTDVTHGFSRKLIIIPFRKNLADEMPVEEKMPLSELRKRYKLEAPGILNKLMEGYRRLRRNNKFTVGRQVREELEAYQVESDTALAFWKDEAYPEKDKIVAKAEIYRLYEFHCRDGGKFPVNRQTFLKRLGLLSRTTADRERAVVDGKRQYILRDWAFCGMEDMPGKRDL